MERKTSTSNAIYIAVRYSRIIEEVFEYTGSSKNDTTKEILYKLRELYPTLNAKHVEENILESFKKWDNQDELALVSNSSLPTFIAARLAFMEIQGRGCLNLQKLEENRTSAVIL